MTIKPRLADLGIATTVDEFVDAYGNGSGFTQRQVSALAAALLISPIGFGVSSETCADNVYMDVGSAVDVERAHAQHAGLVRTLGEIDVPVVLFPGRQGMPDAVFPNNAFATVPGALIVGSMKHSSRRRETEREDIRSFFDGTLGYKVRDLSSLDGFAELTGSLIIDRSRGLGFCGTSGRTDDVGCKAMHDAFDLALSLRFELVPAEYHTNIVLSVLAGRAALMHPPSFVDGEIPVAIRRVYGDGAIVLSDEEKEHFAGNCLAVSEHDVLFSETALNALRPTTRAALEAMAFRLHDVQVDEFEKAGGSLRCLIAEVF
jgi:hypothetical protein